ncbi:aminopeptidase N [Rubricella aquisinus]|uniref:Aminopeptidase N n=1 Tax=Rubricella aquisinus TaxID=2028108 RepID=A0A840X0J0_9RHOB|nr:aminopeptidase N [Rubricella aquisinus]MBB5516244.1 aminopeptidase N [Rubricella aquisinus]
MRTDTQHPVTRLAAYSPPAWLVERVSLTFSLKAEATRVASEIVFVPNPARADGDHPLELDGEQLTLMAAWIDGQDVTPDITATGLTVQNVPQGGFTWTAEVEINPAANTALEGLYMSNAMYCTQCEAEGFRKITYYPDRPDVMAPFTVRIEGDLPVMLSNGNPTAQGDGWAEWHDPWPKPAYLFALVAGELVSVDDTFTTMSGRKVDLKIYVRPGDEGKCAYAMDALKRSMRWDETEYGREYDLDLFMIVAVDDFNMGAMENKGLNIFNSRYVLATPDTATDLDFERIEAIIAHEYFHNWTGNRITCRDWFQLCLKEGLTVFRDQRFTGDMRSEPVKRIDDVKMLRARQFREDSGPLAHPVRPAEYVEINNFYTATVYEKGAELIRMLWLMVGPQGYRRGTDLYFERHDGQACTIEDWLKVFEDACDIDLSQFALWYAQAGTPRVDVAEAWEDGRYTLTFTQTVPDTPGQTDKKPVPIPMAYGLLDKTGAEVAQGLHVLTQPQESLSFDLAERPVPSLLRGFSAPVTLARDVSAAEQAFLLAHDSDPFNRWEAGRAMMLEALTSDRDNAALGAGLQAVLTDETLDPAFRALTLTLPSEEEIAAHVAGRGQVVDPSAIHDRRAVVEHTIATALGDALPAVYAAMRVDGPYSPDGAAPGQRALRARLLAYLTRLDRQAVEAKAMFDTANNMTETMAALALLVSAGQAQDALAAFETKWATDALVMDKWFTVQAVATPPAQAVATVKTLTQHAAFNWKNPNRFRAVIGAFAVANPAGFHRADGSGYTLLADWLLTLDPVNPQTTARVAGAFETWRRLDRARQALIGPELERIASAPTLSRDMTEIIGRIRAA